MYLHFKQKSVSNWFLYIIQFKTVKYKYMEEKIYKFCEKFAKNIKNERLSLGLTQKEVADKIGIKTQSYQAYEKCIAMPNLVNLLKLSELFHVSLDDLFEIKYY